MADGAAITGAGRLPWSGGAKTRADADTAVATGAVIMAGAGVIAAFAGALSGDLPVLLLGVGALGAGALVLLGAGWLEGFALLVVSLPMPAPYAGPDLRVAPAAAVTALFVVAWLLRRTLDGSRIELRAVPRRAAVGLLAAVALAAVAAHQRGPAVRELVSFALLAGLLVAVTDEVGRSPRRARSLARLLAVVVPVAGALAALQMVGVIPGNFPLRGTPLTRATLGFGWPNELGMFMAMGLPFAVLAVQTARTRVGRWASAAGLVFALLGLVATFSRGSWLATLAATFVLVFVGRGRAALAVWALTAVAALLLDLASGGYVIGRIADLAVDSVAQQRFGLLLAGLLMFWENPLLGVGPGGFAAALETYGTRIPFLWDYVGSAHNAYVHMAAETGLIGLAAFVAFLGASLLTLVRGARRAVVAASTLGASGAGPESDGTGATGTGLTPREEAALRTTLAWSFAIACTVSLFEWSLAHGLGQLVMLVAGMGFGLEARRGGAP